MYACLHAAGNPALLVECARYFSPRIEETSSDTVLFDVRGLGFLIGGPCEIARAIENRAGIPVDIAIAADPDAAIIAARGIRGITVIAPGDEAAILSRLPLNLLPGSPETAELLDAWGIRTLGELAMLPPLGVAARLGPKEPTFNIWHRGASDGSSAPSKTSCCLKTNWSSTIPLNCWSLCLSCWPGCSVTSAPG